MSSIWAAPFLGEFGWECSVWAPWLRYQHHRLGGLPITVICEVGKAALYEDFAEVIEASIFSEPLRRDCQNAFRPEGGKLIKYDYENYVTEVAGGSKKCITPIDMQLRWPNAKHSRWHKYRRDIDDPRNRVLIHARNHQHPTRNWSPARWNDLVDRLAFDAYDVMSIGSKAGAFHIDGTVDARGVPIDDLINYLSMADFIVGPSSGPLAFALLCETPTVWWSGNNKDVPRFWKDWNPFDTAQCAASKTWNPTVQEVYETCQKF
jgi:hypothetical protein